MCARVFCVFRPAFGCCNHPEAGRNLFLPFFNLFCSFQSFFGDFTTEITKKCLKMNKKTCFCVLLKAGRLPEGVPRICLFRLIFKVSTRFWVRKSPKSWSKYTTHVCVCVSNPVQNTSLCQSLIT